MRSRAEASVANGDQITAYLEELRRRLAGGMVRTSREHAAQIVAEAENHLREAAAASVATGMSEQAAQGAAIAAFGQARTVVRAHRPPAAAVLAKLATATCPLMAAYLLVSAAIGGAGIYWEARTSLAATSGVVVQGGSPGKAPIVASAPVSGFPVGQVAAPIVACAIAGLVVLAGYLIVRRRPRSRGGTARAVPLPGFFFPVAAVGMVLLGAAEWKAAMHGLAPIIWIEQLPGSYELGIGAILAAVVTALACGAWSAILLARWTINRLTRRPSTIVSAG